MGYICETELAVRYAETDRMGIVHHSRYYPWFEVARTDFIKKSGMSYSEMEKMGIWLPLTESSAKYMIGLCYGDEALIKTRLAEITVVKCVFEYEVYRKSDGKLAAAGRTVHGFTTPELKPFNMKKRFPELWNRLSELTGGEE